MNKELYMVHSFLGKHQYKKIFKVIDPYGKPDRYIVECNCGHMAYQRGSSYERLSSVWANEQHVKEYLYSSSVKKFVAKIEGYFKREAMIKRELNEKVDIE